MTISTCEIWSFHLNQPNKLTPCKSLWIVRHSTLGNLKQFGVASSWSLRLMFCLKVGLQWLEICSCRHYVGWNPSMQCHSASGFPSRSCPRSCPHHRRLLWKSASSSIIKGLKRRGSAIMFWGGLRKICSVSWDTSMGASSQFARQFFASAGRRNVTSSSCIPLPLLSKRSPLREELELLKPASRRCQQKPIYSIVGISGEDLLMFAICR